MSVLYLSTSEDIWTVKVTTESDASCGIHVVLCGLDGETEPMEFMHDSSEDNMEILKKGNTDEFELKVSSEQAIGEIYKVRVCLDERLKDNSWSFEKVRFYIWSLCKLNSNDSNCMVYLV